VKQAIGNDGLNLSNISFNESPSPINQTTANLNQEEVKEALDDAN
jgi:hypothetical protein